MKFHIHRRVAMVSAAALVSGVLAVGISVGTSSAGTPVPGVTAHTITIGATEPLSGPASVYAEASASANAVFKYVNAKKGGINGRTINYIRLDDCYNLAPLLDGCGDLTASQTTLTQTEVLVDTDHVFATVGSLGTAAQESVLAYLKTNHVPQLFVSSGASQFNNPSKYPDTFGFLASYEAEGQLFANLIKTKYKGKSVGFIGQNDGFGQDGYNGLTKDTGITITGGENLYSWIDTGDAPDIEGFVHTLSTDHVKVVVVDAVPPETAAILQDAHNLGFAPTWIISSVGSDPISVNNTLENNATSLDAFPATNANTNTWMKFIRAALLADKTDFPSFTSSTPIDGNMQYGAAYAVTFLEALKSLGTNVTQAGIVKAMTTVKFANPSVVPFSYSKTNHQGLQCGLITTIKSGATASSKYVSEPTKSVMCSTGKAGTKITTGKYAISAIPSYL